ncbi:MAG: hypothetical protein WA116_07555 [Anaerolineaceae bacterium]
MFSTEQECPPPGPQVIETIPPSEPEFPKFRARLGLTLTMIGFLIFLIGSKPGLFGLDRGASVGFVQIVVILLGIVLLAWGAAITLLAFWRKKEKSLLADFGTRVISTGYLICAFTSLADAFGFGTNPMPNVYLGRLQSYGLMIGMGIIAIGLLMLLRYKRE